jgi:hypothetical protein
VVPTVVASAIVVAVAVLPLDSDSFHLTRKITLTLTKIGMGYISLVISLADRTEIPKIDGSLDCEGNEK